MEYQHKLVIICWPQILLLCESFVAVSISGVLSGVLDVEKFVEVLPVDVKITIITFQVRCIILCKKSLL